MKVAAVSIRARSRAQAAQAGRSARSSTRGQRTKRQRGTRFPAAQLELPLPNPWGGRRVGAGRKPAAGRRRVAHRVRPEHRRAEPVHVTLRCRVRSLRQQQVFPTVAGVIRAANRDWSGRFRIIHYSVQLDHLHLLVEAEDRTSLTRAMKGFSVRLARRVNRLLFRRGPLLADRWHGRALATPRAVRHALVYVLSNFRKHGGRGTLDRYSSAPYFSGFAECGERSPAELDPRIVPLALRSDPPPAVRPMTWLLRVGWLRYGRLSWAERPASV